GRPRGAAHGDVGVVAYHVDTTELGDGPVAQRLHLLWLADVGGHGEHRRPAGAERRGRLLERLRLDVGQDDLRTLGGEAVGERATDSARAGGDDHDRVLQLSHAVRLAQAGRRRQTSASPRSRRDWLTRARLVNYPLRRDGVRRRSARALA